MIASLKRHWPWLLMALGVPLALPGLFLLPNEYEALGGPVVDCDGPFLLAFSVPGMLVYLACAFGFARRARHGGGRWAAVGALLCLGLAVALAANSLAAARELHRPDHRASCA